jgi:hypothetical protein
VELRATFGDDVDPHPRDGCKWTFDDTARYRAVKVTGPVRIATCTPDDPGSARVLAWLVTRDHVTYEVAGVVPAGRLVAGKAWAEEIAGAVRFR